MSAHAVGASTDLLPPRKAGVGTLVTLPVRISEGSVDEALHTVSSVSSYLPYMGSVFTFK